MNTLEIINLCCRRGEQELFRNLNFKITSGQICQIKGINGSGKTSLLRILASLAPMTKGKIEWNQKSILNLGEAYRRQINYIGHKVGFNEQLTVKENLQFLCQNYLQNTSLPLSDILERLQLKNKLNCLSADLSAGQKKRIMLAKLLLLNVPLWILDEPFSAIDQKGVEMLQRIMQTHLENQGLIIFTSHQSTSFSQEVVEVNLDD